MTDFVLIHGAYQGGWIWKLVSERLRAKGHNVLAPTLDGCAERAEGLRPGITTETHGARDRQPALLPGPARMSVLVGTSSGGMVMACAAEKARERVARARLRRRAGAARRREDPRHRQAPDHRGRYPAGARTLARGRGGAPVRRSRSGHARMGRRPRDAASRGRLQPARQARVVLGPEVGRRRALLQPGAQPRRGAHQAGGRQARTRAGT